MTAEQLRKANDLKTQSDVLEKQLAILNNKDGFFCGFNLLSKNSTMHITEDIEIVLRDCAIDAINNKLVDLRAEFRNI